MAAGPGYRVAAFGNADRHPQGPVQPKEVRAAARQQAAHEIASCHGGPRTWSRVPRGSCAGFAAVRGERLQTGRLPPPPKISTRKPPTRTRNWPPLQYNLGTAAYKSGQYDKALPAFQSTLKTDKLDLQQQAYYNIGNTEFRVGQQTEKAKPEDTIKTWTDAVASYDELLETPARRRRRESSTVTSCKRSSTS